ncbi:MAG: serine/threonine-protein kinase [Erysipelotrichaceae bacterium]|nr:serine/threonine-protein kinase [Erysipelotrichaceae bacterium]
MRDRKAALLDLAAQTQQTDYPEAFLRDYIQLECLANSHGTETFLVKRRSDERLLVAKCYDKKAFNAVHESEILRKLCNAGIPAFAAEIQNEQMVCIIRDYIEGEPLNKYLEMNHPDKPTLIGLGIQLCEILIYLHGQDTPVIHRDIKPQNIIIKDDGTLVLIDFDISRLFNQQAETDTQFFGTKEYAPPEQYGFAQTDARTDIYSFGVLLGYMLTGSEKVMLKAIDDKALREIVRKCTAFAPKDRFANASALKKALLKANPHDQFMRRFKIGCCAVLLFCLAVFGIYRWYEYVTFDPFADGHIPAVLTDEERQSDAVAYLQNKYDTDLFNAVDSYATFGFVKQVLIDVYGYERSYIEALPETDGVPQESPNNFFPWALGDEQNLPRDILAYTAVKHYWLDKISDYSGLKDDNGYYPGVRVAVAYCEDYGIFTGVGNPEDLTVGETAIILANADRIYEATKAE